MVSPRQAALTSLCREVSTILVDGYKGKQLYSCARHPEFVALLVRGSIPMMPK